MLLRDCYEDGVCPDCGENIPEDAVEGYECLNCGHIFYFSEDTEHDMFRDDVEADADVLRMAGMGTDEDYGYYGEE